MGWTSRGRLWRREERCYMIGRKLQMENTLWQGEELSQKQLNGTSLLGDNLKCNTNATFLGDQGGFKYGMPQRQFWTTNFPVREGSKLGVKLMMLKKRFLGGNPVLNYVIFVFMHLNHLELAS